MATKSKPPLVLSQERKKELELQVMAHRYMYYVECNPMFTDWQYDHLQKLADAHCPPESPVHKVGSDLAESYTEEQREYAAKIRRGEVLPQ